MAAKRRIDVMLSSTFLDLEQHRDAVIEAMNGLQLTPLAQEFDASSNSDLIKSSLDKVEAADVYVGLIGSRYGQRPECPNRNPDRLSLTELEYRRAAQRQLPRLMFIMADDHPLTLADLKRSQEEGQESRSLQQAFIARVRKDLIAAEFCSPTDLKSKANTSFVALQKSLDRTDTAATALPTQQLPSSPDDNVPTVPPAFHYVRKPYVERQGFAGRAAELALMDQWATGTDAMLLFQAIGGMGKSMLTWHWLRTRAAAVRGDWAGRLWYSFYEQGADLNDFCVHALAYIRHEAPKKFRGRRTLDLGGELLRELDARPWLLILDGLERVLVAYNRAGKEHMTDEEAVVARDGMGLDREPRDCFRPEDDDVLAMLAQADRGKLLASSRLTPTTLTNTARQPIPGVMRVALEGLAPEDAEQVLRNAGVRGDGWKMRHFLDDKFRCHPLSVGVVAGQVATHLDARGDFDRWVEYPKGGADPALIAKDLRGRQNHVLARSFDDLDDDVKALLGSIAMASIELTPDVLRILNPKHPIEPKKVDPADAGAGMFDNRKHWTLKRDRDRAKTDEARAAAQEKLDAYRKQHFAEQQQRYVAYVATYTAWQEKARDADEWLAHTLPTLEARALLQYDGDTGSLDIHPAIRHTALISLSPEAKSSTGNHVSDALSSRAVKPLDDARTLEDLALPITRVEALIAAGKPASGWELLESSNLDNFLFSLEYHHKTLELLQPLFPEGWENGPLLLPKSQHGQVFRSAAVALKKTGRLALARNLYVRSIRLGISDSEQNVAGRINDLCACLEVQGEKAHAIRLLTIACRLAKAFEDEDDWILCNLNLVEHHIISNDLDQAKALLDKESPNKETVRTLKSYLLARNVLYEFRAGLLTEATVDRSLKELKALRVRATERAGLFLIGMWCQSIRLHERALDTYSDLIALANEVGAQDLAACEARRAISLVALGRREEAQRVATKVDQGKNPPHVSLALLYLELRDPTKARSHALAGYTEAWGEGPPYHDHWSLEDCRKVLAAVGEPEPVLPPFDASKVRPFDFEPDIERLIDKKLAEKIRLAEERARREATRQAEMTKSVGSPNQS